jgi:hypothetical protein
MSTMSSSPMPTMTKAKNSASLLSFFINSQRELAHYKNGTPIVADGQVFPSLPSSLLRATMPR